ncbi:MAG: glycosyl hydrolase, partial [Candidatus Neomarinimicrobiota bacterium]|nr:glycosyl hydrolase [Candidatus Neomarinimicrobiota bacterium]
MRRFKLFLLYTFILSIVFGQDKKSENFLTKLNLGAFKLRSVGPALTSGRVSDFAVHPDKRHEYYIATSSGGVWKTINGGANYTPIFDQQGSYSIGCITMDPNNPYVIWVGTGENNNQRSVGYGDGIYRSKDGGKTWKHMGLKNSEHIAKIIVDPRNSNIVYVAAIGPLWSEGGDRGLYKSMDGGKTWESKIKVDEHTGVTDLIMDPNNPDVLYAATYQRRRHVFTWMSGGPGSGLYKSTDSGESWEQLKTGLPTSIIGRIGLAMSPADSDIVYAIVEAMDGQQGFYRTSNRGGSWKKMSNYVTSGNYYQEIVVDPKDVNTVYSLSTYNMVTRDGGKTFSRLGEKNKHVDNHVMWIDPDDTDYLLVGCDGGIYESFDRGKNWIYKENLPVTQFYKVTVDNDLPFYNIYGGTQDNYSLGGPSRTKSQNGITNEDWFVTLGGDGFESAVDPENPNIIYAQYQYGNLYRFDKASGERIDIKPRARKNENAYTWNWDAPLQVSSHVPKRVYFAANKLFRSDDRGNTWEVISDELSRGVDRNKLKVMGRTWSVDMIEKNGGVSKFGAAIAFHESPIDKNLLYVGTDDGLIHVTENSGNTWKKYERFSNVPKMTYVNMLLASQHDENVVYSVFNNHKKGDFKPYLFRSDNKGKSWKSISSNLPIRGSVYSIAEDHIDPNLLFVGTEFGLFFSLDGGAYWKQIKAGLPTIAVRDLAIQERENDLILGTFGRGFYVLDDYSALRNINQRNMQQEAQIFPIKDGLMFIQGSRIGGNDKGFQGENYFTTPNPPVGVTFTYFLKESINTLENKRKKKEAKLRNEGKDVSYPSFEDFRKEKEEKKPHLIFTISDKSGNIIRRLSKPARAGVNRLTWDYKMFSAGPINASDAKKGFPSSGAYVAPGEYTVTMSKVIDGLSTNIAGPVSFRAKTLSDVTLPANNRRELSAFQEQIGRLQSVIRTMNTRLNNTSKELAQMRAAAQGIKNDNSKILMGIDLAQEKITIIQRKLNGDWLAYRLDVDLPPSISDRVNRAAYGVLSSSSAPTTTQREAYNIANSEL